MEGVNRITKATKERVRFLDDDERKAHTNQDAKICGIQRFSKEERKSVHARIADTALPEIDPIMGASGPVSKLWLHK